MIESGLLKALLLNVIFGGAAGVAVWRFVESKAGQALRDRLAAWLGYFGLEPPEVTRYLTMTLSVLVLLAAYGVALAFAFVPDPGTAEGWLNLIIQLFGAAYAMSQVLHARRKTRLELRRRQHPVDPVTAVYQLDPDNFGSFLPVHPIINVPPEELQDED